MVGPYAVTEGTGATQPTTLAVIIVSWNVREHLDRCLASLRKALNEDGVSAQVCVVDNASTDDSVAMIRRKHAWVHLEVSADNLGFVRGNNLALAQLADNARYLWLLNPDTIVNPGDVKALIAFMDTHPRVGLAGPLLLNPDATVQECAFRFPGLSQALFALELMPDRFYYTALNGRYPAERFTQPTPFPIDHPLGAAMLARADAVHAVGPLDDGFFMYCEEIDWAWRMRKAGWESWLVPGVKITHVGGASSSQARPETTAYLWESRARLYRKHREPLTRALTALAVRRVFTRRLQKTSDATWVAAYTRILAAWQA